MVHFSLRLSTKNIDTRTRENKIQNYIAHNKYKIHKIQNKQILTNENNVHYKHVTPFDINLANIPKIIYQTWHSHKLPPNIKLSVNQIKNNHPDFTYNFFDDNDCREFIKEHYDSATLNAFDRLIPGAYKADLWRYCVLYKTGGIYLDIKYKCVNGFNFNQVINNEHWVLDNNNLDIYNALLVCNPGNPILLACIRQIIVNVNTNYYGANQLCPTGPALLRNKLYSYIDNVNAEYKNKIKNNIDMQHILRKDNKFIFHKKKRILQMCTNYYQELTRFSKVPSYGDLWHRRLIYKPFK